MNLRKKEQMNRRLSGLLVVTVVLGFLVGSARTTWAASFREVPPTIGAYTLRGGEWQIGADMEVGLETLPEGISLETYGLSVAYGVTNQFQAGIASHTQFVGGAVRYLRFSAKLRLSFGADLDLGVPFGVGFYDVGEGIQLGLVNSGAVLSLRVGRDVAFHGGLALGISPQFYVSPYGIIDFDLLPNIKLVGELGLIPLSAAVGAWIRLLDFLDVKLALTPVPLSFTGGLYLRF
jgi:hypothetical protein